MIEWQRMRFEQLTNVQLYQLLKLRVDVFVVEQTCPYPELDNKDLAAGVYQLIGIKDREIVACARLLAPGISYPSASIGRVATSALHRGGGLGHELMQQAVAHCSALWPQDRIEIGAQAHLERFYAQHGFVKSSDTYLEDGIPHIDMQRDVSEVDR